MVLSPSPLKQNLFPEKEREEKREAASTYAKGGVREALLKTKVPFLNPREKT